jgi:hypothetical protein
MRTGGRHTVVAAGTRWVDPSLPHAGRSGSRSRSAIAANVHAPAGTAHMATASMRTSG